MIIEEERIESIKDWPKPKFIKDIEVFLAFANCYPYLIQGFTNIAVLLMSMLETITFSYFKAKKFLKTCRNPNY